MPTPSASRPMLAARPIRTAIPSSRLANEPEPHPMTAPHPLKIAKLADASRVEFGPLAFYHPLVADGDTPVRTGIRTSAPGYGAPMHFHPYVELLFIIEGEAEGWLQ